MDDRPLVSVNIPTWNSEEFIKTCLASVEEQTYPNIETLVIDSESTDNTREIAQRYGARVVVYKGKLLGARKQGLNESKGNYLLLLDSDQILEPTAIERAVELMTTWDMLVLEEHSWKPKTWLEKLFEADRKLIHNQVSP